MREKRTFCFVGTLINSLQPDISAEERAALLGEPDEKGLSERADARNRGNAQGQGGQENAKASKPAAQFPPCKAQRKRQRIHGHSLKITSPNAGRSKCREASAARHFGWGDCRNCIPPTRNCSHFARNFDLPALGEVIFR